MMTCARPRPIHGDARISRHRLGRRTCAATRTASEHALRRPAHTLVNPARGQFGQTPAAPLGRVRRPQLASVPARSRHARAYPEPALQCPPGVCLGQRGLAKQPGSAKQQSGEADRPAVDHHQRCLRPGHFLGQLPERAGIALEAKRLTHATPQHLVCLNGRQVTLEARRPSAEALAARGLDDSLHGRQPAVVGARDHARWLRSGSSTTVGTCSP